MYKRPANAADVRWYVYDGLGSVVGEVDVSGNLTAEKKHDVFGLRRGTVGTEKSRHGFVGGLGHYSDDETGLVYMRARYYDPAIGRFVSQDPAHDGTNWFSYCSNDPINKVDGNGLWNEAYFQALLKSLEEACGKSPQLAGLAQAFCASLFLDMYVGFDALGAGPGEEFENLVRKFRAVIDVEMAIFEGTEKMQPVSLQEQQKAFYRGLSTIEQMEAEFLFG